MTTQEFPDHNKEMLLFKKLKEEQKKKEQEKKREEEKKKAEEAKMEGANKQKEKGGNNGYDAQKLKTMSKEEEILTHNEDADKIPEEKRDVSKDDLAGERVEVGERKENDKMFILKQEMEEYDPYHMEKGTKNYDKIIAVCKSKDELRECKDLGGDRGSAYGDVIQRESKGFYYDTVPVIKSELLEKESGRDDGDRGEPTYSVIFVKETRNNKEQIKPLCIAAGVDEKDAEETAQSIKEYAEKYNVDKRSFSAIGIQDVSNRLDDKATAYYDPDLTLGNLGDGGVQKGIEIENDIPTPDMLRELEEQKRQRLEMEYGEDYDLGGDERVRYYDE